MSFEKNKCQFESLNKNHNKLASNTSWLQPKVSFFSFVVLVT
jgi:hypothetical protein